MADARRIGVPELREIVSDAAELKKGVQVFDDGGLRHLSRFQNKVFAEAMGSGSSPYKVSLTFADAGPEMKARCSCFASRTRPFCKHAAALVVAWARAPESFVVADVAPPTLEGGVKKAKVKQGKTDAGELLLRGVEQADTLARELAVAGVASIAADRLAQIRALGESLRENRLRRLSARTLDLVKMLEKAPDPSEYAELLTDMVLTIRKLQKHLAGEVLEDRYVEELLGKTWRKTDRTPVEGLDLVEYAFRVSKTSDAFVIRESRFVDLVSGEHYSEKQILPELMAKRTEPKRSYLSSVLHGARGSQYPSFSPYRLDLEAFRDPEPVASNALERVLEKAHATVGGALALFQERRRDVFAPDRLPAAVRVETVFAGSERMQIVDENDQALFLPDDRGLEERLATALREANLRALLGDVEMMGALPTLVPLAAVVDGREGLELHPVATSEALVLSKKQKIASAPTERTAWVDVARSAGVSAAAVSLGEIREELASVLVTGLMRLGPRIADPLVARLTELGLDKQSDLLRSLVDRPEAADRLDDFVKLYQVLGIAMVRVTGATPIERASLVTVPTYESVFVRRPDAIQRPADVSAACASGMMNRYEAAVHYAGWYESLPADELARAIYPTWADGSASRYVARAFARRGVEALAAVEKALAAKRGRVVKLTAVHVLESVCREDSGSSTAQEAVRILRDLTRSRTDAGLRALAASAVARVERRPTRAGPGEPWATAAQRLLGAPTLEERIDAMDKLERHDHLGVIPALRAAFWGDVSRVVRREAAYALARLGDTDMVDAFIRMLASRAEDDETAKVGAKAIGYLGDVRGIHALLEAYAEGWKPGTVAEAIRELGEAALEPLVALIEERPEIAGRKAALSVLEALPTDALGSFLVERLASREGQTDLANHAALYLKLASVDPGDHARVAGRILELSAAGALEGKKALLKAARAAFDGPRA